jgi:hypothetical protein
MNKTDIFVSSARRLEMAKPIELAPAFAHRAEIGGEISSMPA